MDVTRRYWAIAFSASALVAGAMAPGCSCGGDDVVPGGEGGAASGTGHGGVLTVGNGGATVTCTEPCPSDQVCSHGVCVPLLECQNDDDCKNDTYCESAEGCLPWEGADPKHD